MPGSSHLWADEVEQEDAAKGIPPPEKFAPPPEWRGGGNAPSQPPGFASQPPDAANAQSGQHQADGRHRAQPGWDDNATATRGGSRSRLDMGHGFVRNIAHNQHVRQDYESQWQASRDRNSDFGRRSETSMHTNRRSNGMSKREPHMQQHQGQQQHQHQPPFQHSQYGNRHLSGRLNHPADRPMHPGNFRADTDRWRSDVYNVGGDAGGDVEEKSWWRRPAVIGDTKVSPSEPIRVLQHPNHMSTDGPGDATQAGTPPSPGFRPPGALPPPGQANKAAAALPSVAAEGSAAATDSKDGANMQGNNNVGKQLLAHLKGQSKPQADIGSWVHSERSEHMQTANPPRRERTIAAAAAGDADSAAASTSHSHMHRPAALQQKTELSMHSDGPPGRLDASKPPAADAAVQQRRPQHAQDTQHAQDSISRMKTRLAGAHGGGDAQATPNVSASSEACATSEQRAPERLRFQERVQSGSGEQPVALQISDQHGQQKLAGNADAAITEWQAQQQQQHQHQHQHQQMQQQQLQRLQQKQVAETAPNQQVNARHSRSQQTGREDEQFQQQGQRPPQQQGQHPQQQGAAPDLQSASSRRAPSLESSVQNIQNMSQSHPPGHHPPQQQVYDQRWPLSPLLPHAPGSATSPLQFGQLTLHDTDPTRLGQLQQQQQQHQQQPLQQLQSYQNMGHYYPGPQGLHAQFADTSTDYTHASRGPIPTATARPPMRHGLQLSRRPPYVPRVYSHPHPLSGRQTLPMPPPYPPPPPATLALPLPGHPPSPGFTSNLADNWQAETIGLLPQQQQHHHPDASQHGAFQQQPQNQREAELHAKAQQYKQTYDDYMREDQPSYGPGPGPELRPGPGPYPRNAPLSGPTNHAPSHRRQQQAPKPGYTAYLPPASFATASHPQQPPKLPQQQQEQQRQESEQLQQQQKEQQTEQQHRQHSQQRQQQSPKIQPRQQQSQSQQQQQQLMQASQIRREQSPAHASSHSNAGNGYAMEGLRGPGRRGFVLHVGQEETSSRTASGAPRDGGGNADDRSVTELAAASMRQPADSNPPRGALPKGLGDGRHPGSSTGRQQQPRGRQMRSQQSDTFDSPSRSSSANRSVSKLRGLNRPFPQQKLVVNLGRVPQSSSHGTKQDYNRRHQPGERSEPSDQLQRLQRRPLNQQQPQQVAAAKTSAAATASKTSSHPSVPHSASTKQGSVDRQPSVKDRLLAMPAPPARIPDPNAPPGKLVQPAASKAIGIDSRRFVTVPRSPAALQRESASSGRSSAAFTAHSSFDSSRGSNGGPPGVFTRTSRSQGGSSPRSPASVSSVQERQPKDDRPPPGCLMSKAAAAPANARKPAPSDRKGSGVEPPAQVRSTRTCAPVSAPGTVSAAAAAGPDSRKKAKKAKSRRIQQKKEEKRSGGATHNSTATSGSEGGQSDGMLARLSAMVPSIPSNLFSKSMLGVSAGKTASAENTQASARTKPEWTNKRRPSRT